MQPNMNREREYPWGRNAEDDQPDPERANYDKTGIGTTSAVGCFPAGASPYGCEDMAGNVWEWTRSLYQRYPYPADPKEREKRDDPAAGDTVARVLRGGAFASPAWDARCAFRLRGNPDLRSVSFVFRVVVSPLRNPGSGD